MLKTLHIKNIVLIESCQIAFVEGLTVLTGESGAGKTAILHALKLVLGQKLDTSLIRLGEKKASVQAEFSSFPSSLLPLFAEIGLEVEDSSLFLFREISIDGKSKCFINERAVSLSFLQKVSGHLIQIVDQSSYQELRHHDVQRELLDLFGSLTKEVQLFGEKVEERKKQTEQEKALENLAKQKERELEFCLSQEKELSSFSLEEEEEDLLFQEYSLASRAQEVAGQTDKLFGLLSEAPYAVLTGLKQTRALCRSLASIHSIFAESETLLTQSSLCIEEVLHLLQKGSSLFDVTPKRLEYLEDRLSLIDKIKKKYGALQEERTDYLKQLKAKIHVFDSLENEKNALEIAIASLEEELTARAKDLSEKRNKTAQTLTFALERELQDLNMKQAQIRIQVENQPRNVSGEDKVSFLLAANPGESLSRVKDHSSGGELSRLLLAFKICLAEKNNTPIIVFDEIDANVGGETARMIGEKLLKLSSYKQILCVTHFPQVACQALLHLRVHKESYGERTFATVLPLDAKLKEKELLRMLGGTQLV